MTTRFSAARLAIAVGASLALLAPAGRAAAQAGDVMSVGELTACAREAAGLQAEKARLAERRTALAGRKTRLAAEMAEAGKESRKGAAGEAPHRAQSQALEVVNRDVDALNADGRRVEARQRRYNAGCAARRYREPDIGRLSPELRQALEAGRAKDTMNLAELRACAERALALGPAARRGTDADVTARRAALDAERKALEAKGADVNRLARSELEALRAQRRAFNARVDALNAEVEARNAAARTGNAAALAYEAECSSRPYLEEDVARLPPELRAAMGRQAAPGEAR